MSTVAGTRPYAWPYDGSVDGRRLALVLAGWDTEWSSRGTGPGAADNALALAAAVAAVGGLVVPISHGAAPLDLPPSVPAAEVVAVPAAGLDGFFGSSLDVLLRARGRTQLLLVGHGIEGTVHSTLRSANDRGYECLLVTDACTALVPDLALASGETVTMSGGIFGAIGTTSAVLAALAALPSIARPKEA